MSQPTTNSTVSTPGPRPSVRIKGLFDATRLWTRVWYDLLGPLAMCMVLRHGHLAVWPVVGTILAIELFHAAGDYFNDLADTVVDRSSIEDDRNQRPLVTARITRRDLWIVGWIATVASLVVAATLRWPSIALLFTAFVMAIAYNFGPHLSARPLVLQLFWPAMWLLMYALCGVATNATHWRDGIPFVLWVATFMGFGEGITQDVRDADNDAAGGRRTTPVAFGVWRTTLWAWLSHVVALAAWIWFCVAFPLPVAPAVLGTVVLLAWQGYFAALLQRLRNDFDKPAARMTHVGPIGVFTLINLFVIFALL